MFPKQSVFWINVFLGGENKKDYGCNPEQHSPEVHSFVVSD